MVHTTASIKGLQYMMQLENYSTMDPVVFEELFDKIAE